MYRDGIIAFLEELPNEVTYHTADGNLKSSKLNVIYEPFSFLTETLIFIESTKGS